MHEAEGAGTQVICKADSPSAAASRHDLQSEVQVLTITHCPALMEYNCILESTLRPPVDSTLPICDLQDGGRKS